MTGEGSDAVRLVADGISVAQLLGIAASGFGDMVKAAVDIEREVMAIGGDLHADGEATLLDDGSRQADIWGINLYPEQYGNDDWLEFDSLINIRPSQGNRSREIEDEGVRRRVTRVVARIVRQDG
ncbi:MAG: DUF5674 family protein [Candidatus Dormibacteria bacterium]